MVRSIRTPCNNLVSSQSYDERPGHDSTRSEERALRIRGGSEVGNWIRDRRRRRGRSRSQRTRDFQPTGTRQHAVWATVRNTPLTSSTPKATTISPLSRRFPAGTADASRRSRRRLTSEIAAERSTKELSSLASLASAETRNRPQFTLSTDSSQESSRYSARRAPVTHNSG